ncbi:MAG: hypothetical protein F6K25_30705 [Okeania sp. SIO2G4]|uniref:hypothetical protein n=1 Tax=unclassified Okeania TaxID=2634635 RepID=UPI0013B72600|nr:MULTISPECIES: hypothetical protein [unclassified Okeania]NEP04124.1 hypothetical protein [Okeania sp. SIO4D6]NEP41181.1 hypothetical protein [Okeania sp. SIO2H7]NEP70721.1 hypothetical protein [Okeania sp. SIO2G5]NEP93420.1 hypothetical protein [Okeania sp. SIO2F5]NEQ94767.1 hypothetical protein [Okeania sp. SIO2G4]
MKNSPNINPNQNPEKQPQMLNPNGAKIILGTPSSDSLVVPLAPSATTMFGPRGACLISETGPLWVADTGHHRLLGWRKCPEIDTQPADWVIGQSDFSQEGQNANGTTTAATVSVPTGICACGEGLAVADAWNHRVLIWKQLPEDNNVPADIVLGQADFSQNESNRGQPETAADRMHWPYGVVYHQGKLWVADTGNRRVLMWHQLPEVNGQPADLVLGQANMSFRDENGGSEATAASMRWPHAITFWGDNVPQQYGDRLIVTDAGNNRVMIWDAIPTENNQPCSVVLGQSQFNTVQLNQGVYFPSAASLSMPYGVAAVANWLIVADTANSRLLGWRDTVDIGTPAVALIGQSDFQSKGENALSLYPTRQSLCWPYGISVCGNTAVIADSGNNRVLLWSLNQDLRKDTIYSTY